MPIGDPLADDLRQQLKAAIEDVLADSAYAPEACDPALLVDVVVVMGWSDGAGHYGTSVIRCGAPWATEGLISEALHFADGTDDEYYPST